SSRRRHTRFDCDWSSDVCSSDLTIDERHWPGGDIEGMKDLLRPMPFVDRLQHTPIPPIATELIGPYFENVKLLGRRTAELHVVRSEERRVGKECRAQRWAVRWKV